MRTSFGSLLVFASVACGCLGPSAYAEPPCPPPAAADARPCAVAPHLEIVDDEGRPLPTFAQTGRRFVLGALGDRYSVRIVNPTGERVEAVLSIDGLDAIDGKPAASTKRGYLVDPYGEVTVDGWRTSLQSVAAFRFSSVHASYAARTAHDRNVGVIGIAFFHERPAVVRTPPSAKASRSEAAPPAAPASGAAASSVADDGRPGLGTEYGEQRDSFVSEVPFERASARPDVVAEIRYDDREGLLARGIRLPARGARDEEVERRDRAEAFPEARFAQPPR